MNLDFAGRRVLITGGASGIGLAAARMFVDAGARVVIADLAEESAVGAAESIGGAERGAYAIQADVTDPDSARGMVDEAVARLGGLDHAVNSAGVGGSRTKTAEFSLEDWNRILAVNLTGVFLSMRYELPVLIESGVESGAGSIVNLASVAGVVGFPGHGAYAASKHGVIGLTRSAALEYAKVGVRVNAVCPAFTRTPMVDRMLAQKPEIEPRLEAAIPVGRFGRPDEVAAGILYLCSDHAGFITGHSLVLDGGLTAG
jgi:NAD(P)-dependent dehydrogenase (short-subunit alcohol dehydrogenase family)